MQVATDVGNDVRTLVVDPIADLGATSRMTPPDAQALPVIEVAPKP